MSDQLSTTLQAHLTSQKREALKTGLGEVPELVFHKFGRVIEQHAIGYVYKRILKKAKLRHIKFHGLRHAFCAHLLSEGVTPYYVSQQVGHASINITCDVYGSWIRTEENRYVNLLDPKHSSAPYVHPVGPEKSQPINITDSSL
jgi:integrase